MNEPTKPSGPVKRIEIDLESATEHYANITLINQSSNEFILDFARLMPGRPKASVSARVIMAPANVKALLRGLAQHVQRYEELHGALPEPAVQPPTVGFGPETGRA